MAVACRGYRAKTGRISVIFEDVLPVLFYSREQHMFSADRSEAKTKYPAALLRCKFDAP